jgi:hypothetical protein
MSDLTNKSRRPSARPAVPVVCPHCGHPPDDFVDEETAVE